MRHLVVKVAVETPVGALGRHVRDGAGGLIDALKLERALVAGHGVADDGAEAAERVDQMRRLRQRSADENEHRRIVRLVVLSVLGLGSQQTEVGLLTGRHAHSALDARSAWHEQTEHGFGVGAIGEVDVRSRRSRVRRETDTTDVTRSGVREDVRDHAFERRSRNRRTLEVRTSD